MVYLSVYMIYRYIYGCSTHHLCHTEAMPKVVKRHFVVVLVDLVEPLAQRIDGYAELLHKAQLEEHGLHQVYDIRIAPFVRIEGWQTQGRLDLIRKVGITNFQEAPLHLLMLW